MCKKQNIDLDYSCVWDADGLPLQNDIEKIIDIFGKRNNRNSYFLTEF